MISVSESYLLVKVVHIIAVMLFVGNMFVSGWWKYRANATKDLEIIRFSVREIINTDWIFSSVAGMTVLFTGITLAFIANIPLTTLWVLISIAMWLLSTLLWAVIMLPIQVWQKQYLVGKTAYKELGDIYWKQDNKWMVTGILAMVSPIIAMIFMVTKYA